MPDELNEAFWGDLQDEIENTSALKAALGIERKTALVKEKLKVK